MRNNGRFTATEENIAMGARELFDITDRCSLHTGVDFPGHKHASFYDIIQVEPEVRTLLDDIGVEVRMVARAVDVEWEMCGPESMELQGSRPVASRLEDESAKDNMTSESWGNNKKNSDINDATDNRPTGMETLQPLRCIKAIKLADGEWIEGDAFVEATGSSGPMGGCTEYGRGCSMCVLRCPAFGPRVSISQRAGLPDLAGKRKAGQFGAFSGSGKLEMESLAPEIQQELKESGVAVVPLPSEKIVREKLDMKVCQQYALDEYAENIILIDTGHAKMMTPYFPLDVLRTIPGFERARYADPYAGGKGNSIRYLSVAERDDAMRVKGFANLFCGGEKSGLFVGHTEAITTGSLAGHNAARLLATKNTESNGHNAGRYIAAMRTGASAGAAQQGKFSNAVPASPVPDHKSAQSCQGLLQLPRSLAVGDLIAYGNERIVTEDGLRNRYTFAGDEFFARMQERGLYTIDADLIRRRVDDAGLLGVYDRKVLL